MKGFFAFIFLLSTCGDNNEYIKVISAHRLKLNSEFSDSRTTPLTPKSHKNFEGLKFFEINPEYKVKAELTRYHEKNIFELPHSRKQSQPYSRFGEVNFELMGQPCKLSVFEAVHKKPGYENYLLICFTDETTGKETYSGGRFLDLQVTVEDELELDFNLAYNPYCAFNTKYSCPIPPKENHLGLAVLAGERYQAIH